MKEIPLDFENNTLKICAFTGHRELEESFSLEKLRQAVETLVEKAGGVICGRMAILAEGDAQEREDICYLEKLPLFDNKGNIIG